jgi:hypothetical protein
MMTRRSSLLAILLAPFIRWRKTTAPHNCDVEVGQKWGQLARRATESSDAMARLRDAMDAKRWKATAAQIDAATKALERFTPAANLAALVARRIEET